MVAKTWSVDLSAPAQADFRSILDWTAENFGPLQAARYADRVDQAIQRLHDGPLVLGSAPREDLGAGLRTLHVARSGGSGRHLLVYHAPSEEEISVLRILHDAMDIGRHIPPSGMAEEPAEMLP